jgi:hypothetical protein
MRSKTMWLALAVAVLGAAYDNFSYVQNIIDPRVYGILLIIIGAAVAVLRVLTTLPLDEK